MNQDIFQTPLADLPLGEVTVGALHAMNVKTLGELREQGGVWPADVTSSVTRTVINEVERLFEEHEVIELLDWNLPDFSGKLIEATGTMDERWSMIRSWLLEHSPPTLAAFNPPASHSAIKRAEEQFGRALPEDYKRFLALHNGQNEFAPFVGLGALLPIEEASAEEIYGEDTPVDPDDVDAGIRAVDYSPGWFPISKSQRNRDYLCIDLDPAEGGQSGQIIEYIVDFEDRELYAASFADLMSRYFREIQVGSIRLD